MNWGHPPVSKKESLRGIPNIAKSKKVANNTYEYTLEDGRSFIRYRFTDVIEFRPDGSMVLNSGGWMSQTTKNRINCFQNRVEIIVNKRQWYIIPVNSCRYGWTWRMGYPFYDGILLDPPDPLGDAKKPYPPGHGRPTRKYKAGRDVGKHYHKTSLRKVEELVLNSYGLQIFEKMLYKQEFTKLVEQAFQLVLGKEEAYE